MAALIKYRTVTLALVLFLTSVVLAGSAEVEAMRARRLSDFSAQWRDNQAQVQASVQKEDYEAALTVLRQAGNDLNRIKALLGEDTHRDMTGQVVRLQEAVQTQYTQYRANKLNRIITQSQQEHETLLRTRAAEKQRRLGELYEQATAHLEGGRNEQALTALNQIIGLEPGNYQARWLLARLQQIRTVAAVESTAAPARLSPVSDSQRRQLAGAVAGAPLPAAGSAPARPAVRGGLTVSYQDTPLEEVLADFRTRTGLNLVVNWNELAVVGILPDDPITLDLKGVSPGSVLKQTLAYVSGGKTGRAAYEVDDDGVITIKVAGETTDYAFQSHYVADLIETSPMMSVGMGMGGMGGGMSGGMGGMGMGMGMGGMGSMGGMGMGGMGMGGMGMSLGRGYSGSSGGLGLIGGVNRRNFKLKGTLGSGYWHESQNLSIQTQ